jgi:plastocyanin
MRSALLSISLLVVACGGAVKQPVAQPAPPPPVAKPTIKPAPPAPPRTGPVHERAAQLRRAGDLLDQSQLALDAGNKNGAEILFSTAELIAGPDAVAELTPRFREGAPPRVATVPEKVSLDQAPQPATVGNSDDDEAAEPDKPKLPERGSLTGTLTIAGTSGGALSLVTLEPIGRTWKPRLAKQRVMEQRERQFAPRLMLIPTGSTVTFPNFDTIFHNVFSTSSPALFDLGLYRQGETRSVTFSKEGIIHIGCNIHSNMGATIVVIGAPHYVVPDGEGKFNFRSLAPGRYTLRAWSEKSKAPITQELTITAGANSVAVGVAADATAGPKLDKFGAPRAR